MSRSFSPGCHQGEISEPGLAHRGPSWLGGWPTPKKHRAMGPYPALEATDPYDFLPWASPKWMVYSNGKCHQNGCVGCTPGFGNRHILCMNYNGAIIPKWMILFQVSKISYVSHFFWCSEDMCFKCSYKLSCSHYYHRICPANQHLIMSLKTI